MTAPRRSRGRPAFEPTAHQRGLVEGMAAVGTQQPEIALALGLDEKTLRKHFASELAVSRVKAMTRVKQGLFHAATGWLKQLADGTVAGTPTREGVTAAIFLCKTLGGMSEKLDVDAKHKHDHKHSGEVAVVATASDAALESAALMDRLAARLAGGAGEEGGLAGDGAA